MKTLEIMLSSLAPATVKQYGSALKQWWSYCNNLHLDPLETDVNSILRFLTEKHEGGAADGSFNSMRAAISLVQGQDLSESTHLKRFFKGIFRKNPPKPKYDKIWNTDSMLDNMGKLYPLDSLDLSQLTEKTVMLLALASAHRAQTLAHIKIENI